VKALSEAIFTPIRLINLPCIAYCIRRLYFGGAKMRSRNRIKTLIVFRTTAEMAADIKQRADQQMVSISAVIRQALLRGLYEIE
jgi:hypothetical protein